MKRCCYDNIYATEMFVTEIVKLQHNISFLFAISLITYRQNSINVNSNQYITINPETN